ncbi:hypothetical protein PLESTB_000189200 [Pleodorina starrii]|uniref:Uncharacterized protein n=1 Tax=Pleodorina starrii TaxID=330485 RepID=A0A9W6BCB4_9CHLO|nr:hypothetical protein PLESTB_000189200 [Pleodorina starrii]GLC73580.1 hypothetical protein PLESTF_001393500 [Pleodorina starrii]
MLRSSVGRVVAAPTAPRGRLSAHAPPPKQQQQQPTAVHGGVPLSSRPPRPAHSAPRAAHLQLLLLLPAAAAGADAGQYAPHRSSVPRECGTPRRPQPPTDLSPPPAPTHKPHSAFGSGPQICIWIWSDNGQNKAA